MIGYFRELRLLPIAMVASACLLALTAADLLLDGNSEPAIDAPAVIADTAVVHAGIGGMQSGGRPQSWAHQMFNFPDSKGGQPASPDLAQSAALSAALPQIASDKNNADIITGSVGAVADAKPDAKAGSKTEVKTDSKPDVKPKGEAGLGGKPTTDPKAAAAAKNPPPAPPDGKVILNAGAPGQSPSERAILDRLSERRQELDKRSRELDIREGLIAEAEKRMDAKLAEIKAAKASLAVAVKQKNAAEAARFKGLVTMYETMKPRDAAKIFDRLETNVLIEVASQINPRNMSEIMAQMAPDSAQRLTVELANRATEVAKDPNADLPKIEGRASPQ
ncbi:MAG: flagellar protein FlbB [Hyphomicrobiales bacterium]|nr:flagellar protein FlbB [Hyphomicrobiales bacterium]